MDTRIKRTALCLLLFAGCATTQPTAEPKKEDNSRNGEKAALVFTLIIAAAMAATALNK